VSAFRRTLTPNSLQQNNRRTRLAFLTSHPIQYHAGWFRALALDPSLDLQVLYCRNAEPREQARAGFGVAFAWDVPLLEGYAYRFLRNVSSRPAIGRFGGLDTPELETVIRQEQFDAVVVNGWHYKSAWQGIRACWRAQVPVLVRSDSHLRTARHPIKRLLKAAPYRWFIPRLNGCLAVGRWSSDYFLHYGARSERVFVVPHAIDPSFACNAQQLSPRRDEFRQRWGLQSGQTVFLFAGKFIGKKRPTDFVDAIRLAHGKDPRIVGLMVGDGPLRASCERLVQDAQLPIRFAGFLNQSEIAQAYLAADALVLPSDGEETWGLVVNEAMICGRPALVSDRVGCGPDLVATGKTGFVFPLGDVEALGAQMVECAARPGLLVAMGENAAEAIRAHSVSVAVTRLKAAISGVLEKQ
jgi:glycosyltransferase involved in cell wall biosynthesis